MARYLALDGDTNLVQLVSGNVKGDGARLEHSLSWEEGSPVSAANAEAIGGRLREQMKANGIAPAPLLVTVGRDRVVVKDLKVPNVPEHEEPGLVRFQALKEFTDGGDEVVLDYIPFGPAAPDGRRVAVVSVRKDLVKAYRKLAEAAGLKLAAITPRPFALLAGLLQAIRATQVPPPEPANAPVGLLVRGQKWGEFLIVRNGAIALSRSIAGPALGSDAALLGEIRRNLALHANQNPDHPVRALYLAEADTPGGLRDRLQSSLAIPVYAYEPVVGIAVPDGPTGALAGLAGLLALKGSRDSSINFVHPREPKPPSDPNKRVLVFGAVAALAFLLALGGFAYMRVHAKSREVATLRRDADDKKNLLDQLDSDVKKAKALEEWSATDVNWLDEFYDLAERMHDTRNVRLLSITVTPIEDRSVPKPGQRVVKVQHPKVAQVVIRGLFASDNALSKFIAELQADKPAYDGLSKDTKSNRVVDRNEFSQEFTLKLMVSKRAPDEYTRVLKVESLPKKGEEGFGEDR